MTKRQASIRRNTRETRISLKLNIDGSGKSKIATRIPFFDHMLTLFTKHSVVDLTLKCDGDVEVDAGIRRGFADTETDSIREIHLRAKPTCRWTKPWLAV
jgi:hypothetical protein